MFNGKDYSPSQILKLCKVDGLRFADKSSIMLNIVATVQAFLDKPDLLKEKLLAILREINEVSIGMSLERLHDIATLGPELDGDLDGLDALTYHLSSDQCQKGIEALQNVLQRFKDQTPIPSKSNYISLS